MVTSLDMSSLGGTIPGLGSAGQTFSLWGLLPASLQAVIIGMGIALFLVLLLSISIPHWHL